MSTYLRTENPVAFDITIAEIEFEGEVVGGTIVYGDEGTEPLIGVTVLESGGFEVDPRNEEVKRLPAVLLKAYGESWEIDFIGSGGRDR